MAGTTTEVQTVPCISEVSEQISKLWEMLFFIKITGDIGNDQNSDVKQLSYVLMLNQS